MAPCAWASQTEDHACRRLRKGKMTFIKLGELMGIVADELNAGHNDHSFQRYGHGNNRR